MKNLLLVLALCLLFVCGSAATAKSVKVLLVQISTCTPNSTYACIGIPSNTGKSVVITAENGMASDAAVTAPTTNGKLATEQRVQEMIAAALAGTGTPTPTPTPAPTASPTPNPSPTANPTPTPPIPSTFDFGVNFRAAATGVTDGANETYSVGDIYPTQRTVGNLAVTFGWLSAVDSRTRNTSGDRRLAGFNFVNGQATFRVDLPSAGTYDLRMALGEKDNSQHAAIQVLDDTIVVLTIPDKEVHSSHYVDATGVDRTLNDWPNKNAAKTGLIFKSTKLIVKVGVTGQNHSYVIAHLFIHKQ
jgi:hypothetical protein